MKDDLDEQFGIGAEQAEAEAFFQEDILNEILAERERQQAVCEHGGDTDKFDQQNTRNDWVAYISAYAGRAANKCARNGKEGQDFRKNMLKVAALSMAAIEAHDKGWC